MVWNSEQDRRNIETKSEEKKGERQKEEEKGKGKGKRKRQRNRNKEELREKENEVLQRKDGELRVIIRKLAANHEEMLFAETLNIFSRISDAIFHLLNPRASQSKTIEMVVPPIIYFSLCCSHLSSCGGKQIRRDEETTHYQITSSEVLEKVFESLDIAFFSKKASQRGSFLELKITPDYPMNFHCTGGKLKITFTIQGYNQSRIPMNYFLLIFEKGSFLIGWSSSRIFFFSKHHLIEIEIVFFFFEVDPKQQEYFHFFHPVL